MGWLDMWSYVAHLYVLGEERAGWWLERDYIPGEGSVGWWLKKRERESEEAMNLGTMIKLGKDTAWTSDSPYLPF